LVFFYRTGRIRNLGSEVGPSVLARLGAIDKAPYGIPTKQEKRQTTLSTHPSARQGSPPVGPVFLNEADPLDWRERAELI
jgi:hypothetical protein